MFCIACGVPLTNENQEGLACSECRRQLLQARRKEDQIVKVKYCYWCGKPYRPSTLTGDIAIRHGDCTFPN